MLLIKLVVGSLTKVMNIKGLEKLQNDLRCNVAQCESPSVIDTLSRKKLSLEKQLQDVNNALDALRNAPEVMKVLELLAKV